MRNGVKTVCFTPLKIIAIEIIARQTKKALNQLKRGIHFGKI
jgi:hypothetical protein